MENRPKFPVIPAVALGLLGVLGLALLLWPGILLSMLPVLIGGVLLVVGVLVLASGKALHLFGVDPMVRITFGIVTLAVALVFLLKQDISLVFLSVLFGLYVLITAGMGIWRMVEDRRAGQPILARALQSVVEVFLGLLLLFAPFAGLTLWVQILGAYFVLAALSAFATLVRAWRLLRKK